MLCTRLAPRKTNHLLIALKCMLVGAFLMKFLDEGKPLPYAQKDEPDDPLAWALWVLGGDVWDERHRFLHEERQFLAAVLPGIRKPLAEYRELFLKARDRRSVDWQRAAAEALLSYFTSLQDRANEADLQEQMI